MRREARWRQRELSVGFLGFSHRWRVVLLRTEQSHCVKMFSNLKPVLHNNHRWRQRGYRPWRLKCKMFRGRQLFKLFSVERRLSKILLKELPEPWRLSHLRLQRDL